MIRCEVESCAEFLPVYSCPNEWSQVGISRFVDAPSRLASYCPKHESEAIAQVTNVREEKISIAKQEVKQAEELLARRINTLAQVTNVRKAKIRIAKQEVKQAEELLARRINTLRSLLG